MWIRRIVRVLAVMASAFVLTSAMMFWLPFLERRIDGIYPVSVDVYDYSPDTYLQDLKELSPAEERSLLDEISTELKQRPNAELLQMKAFNDICVNDLVDCRGLPSSKVKPFIDAILSDRQTAETALYYRAANITSGGSLFISFVALIFAG